MKYRCTTAGILLSAGTNIYFIINLNGCNMEKNSHQEYKKMFPAIHNYIFKEFCSKK